MSIKSGVFKWAYSGGNFEVFLRPNLVFYCPSFPAAAKWYYDDDKLRVDWKNYGKYEFVKSENGFEGSVVENPSNWRKMTFLRELNDIELLLNGDGGGSVWDFEWEKGSFEVEFRADGFNHFVCKDFPAHSHWSLEGNKVDINWGKYGNYELVFDPETKIMNGSVKGEPSKWRRALFKRSLGTEEGATDLPAHDHDHDHVHDENCKHDH